MVCNDADLERAVQAAIGSAFSNAGQRCASGSRLIVFDEVYDRFKGMLVDATKVLRLGPNDDDDFGPVINRDQLDQMVEAVTQAETAGAAVVIGGGRLTDEGHKDGYYHVTDHHRERRRR